jgi:glycosyltransferase involved in cell wall biosynthesis
MPRDPAPVSVIVPAYNAEATIVRALASIAAQTLPPCEVIVVDDGSADATTHAAKTMQDKMGVARLIVIAQKNMGAGAARNRAIAEATQPYLAFLDADDEWLPQKLERSMQVMQEGDFLLVAHDYLDTVDGKDVHIDCRRRFEAGRDPYVTLYLKGYIPSISVVTKREAVIAAGGFDETLRNAQDFDLWLKLLAEAENRFTLFGEALARYHHVDGSIMSHTDRRIACCREIATRYIPAVKARGAPGLVNLWRRLVIVYAEAIRAQPKKKLRYAVRGVIDILQSTLRYPASMPSTANSAEVIETPAQISAAALWVFGILGIYLWQFRDLAAPVLRLLGVPLP